MEQLGLELVLTWDAGAAGGGLSRCTPLWTTSCRFIMEAVFWFNPLDVFVPAAFLSPNWNSWVQGTGFYFVP